MNNIFKKLSALLALTFFLTSCGAASQTATSATKGKKTVKSVLSERANSEASEETTSSSTGTQNGTTSVDTTKPVDYDLTNMNKDMVYALIFQLMDDPTPYVGKTFRMIGPYQSMYYDAAKRDYHYCIVEDALACCTQGLEFDLVNTQQTYPQDGEEIILEGTIETYRNNVDEFLYSRLTNAVYQKV